MLDALKARLEALATVKDRALPNAAIRIAEKVRGTVKGSKRAQQKRRKARRVELTISHGAAAARKMVRVPKRRGSGISIDARVQGDTVVLTASSVVQMLGRRKNETADWLDIFGAQVRAAAEVG